MAILCVLSGALAGGCENASQPDEAPVTALSAPAACDLVQGGCQAGDGHLQVAVRFAQAPRALQPFPVELNVAGATPQAVYVAFSMQGMDMGLNRYRLEAAGAGLWRAAVTLPICVSGRSDWNADFELQLPDQRVQLRLPFILDK